MGEWRLTISELRRQIGQLKSRNITSVQVSQLEQSLDSMEDDFEIQDKWVILDKLNNPTREYDKNLDHYIKFVKEENESFRKYTQLVITAGYATFFGLWAVSNPYISPCDAKLSFLLLAISIFSFITLEVARVGLNGFSLHIKNTALLKGLAADCLDEKLGYVNSSDRYKNRFDLWLSRIWIISYPISLISGLSAIILLGFALFRSLTY